jgi:hypothetical protein
MTKSAEHAHSHHLIDHVVLRQQNTQRALWRFRQRSLACRQRPGKLPDAKDLEDRIEQLRLGHGFDHVARNAKFVAPLQVIRVIG